METTNLVDILNSTYDRIETAFENEQYREVIDLFEEFKQHFREYEEQLSPTKPKHYYQQLYSYALLHKNLATISLRKKPNSN